MNDMQRSVSQIFFSTTLRWKDCGPLNWQLTGTKTAWDKKASGWVLNYLGEIVKKMYEVVWMGVKFIFDFFYILT